VQNPPSLRAGGTTETSTLDSVTSESGEI
jgi:hypothetical protein